MKKMKKSMVWAGMMLATVMTGFNACDQTGDGSVNGIEGEYVGSFSVTNTLKSGAQSVEVPDPGTAMVTLMDSNLIEVHCYGSEIDTTLMLGYYANHDSVMVCLTGVSFESRYGHMLGGGHMSGGMMGDRSKGETDWMHHLNDEHAESDMHFGWFNLTDGSFTYSFEMTNGTEPYYLKFTGIKREAE